MDTYVGVMKGVIYGIAPDARIADLTHDIAPQNILEASARLEAAIDYFPVGTIHVVVVDPGVGSARPSCIVQTERALFVAPDNGVLTLPLHRQPPARVVRLTEKARPYCLPHVSATFQGRDVFAPVAAHLANGLAPDALGDVIAPDHLVTKPLPLPLPDTNASGKPRLRLEIMYKDRFGNLITNLERAFWEEWLRQHDMRDVERAAAHVAVQAGARAWQGLARTFADVKPGEPLAYWGSGGWLEIAVRDGNAARLLAPPRLSTVYLTLQS